MEYTSFIYTFCTFVNLMISITNDMFCVAGFIRESKMIMCEIFYFLKLMSCSKEEKLRFARIKF